VLGRYTTGACRSREQRGETLVEGPQPNKIAAPGTGTAV
jgi:hypothetical protein